MKGACSFEYDFVLLIPCYNNRQGLISSLRSVCYPGPFLTVVVDDGSSAPLTVDVLPSSLPLHLITLPCNQGITAALNAGLQWINANVSTKYIARLDCGDLCVPDRFLKQVAFLDQQADIDIVGSWCLFKNYTTGFQYQYKTPTSPAGIHRGMHFRNMFIHPTVMWRASGAAGLYPEDFPHAEDYGFFYTVLRQGKGAIIPEALVTCEINPKGISFSHRKEQLKSRIRVVRHFSRNRLLKLLGIVRLQLILAMPYSFILNTKRIVYGNQAKIISE